MRVLFEISRCGFNRTVGIFLGFLRLFWIARAALIGLEAGFGTGLSPHRCRPNEFACDLARCIEVSMRCDHFYDCIDLTDELNCIGSIHLLIILIACARLSRKPLEPYYGASDTRSMTDRFVPIL